MAPRLLTRTLLLALAAATSSAFLVSPPPSRLGATTTTSSVRSASTSLFASQSADGRIRGKPIPEKKEWVQLLKATDIAPGDIIPVSTDGLALLLVADEDGAVYCTAGNSPFMSAPLEWGKLKDGCIVCPQSGSAFDLETGALVGPWCPFPPVLGPLVMAKLYPARDLAVYPVRAKGSNIEALIDRNLKLQFESTYWAGILDAQGKATGDYY